MTHLDLLIHVKANKEWTESISVGLRLARQLGARAHGLLTLGELARAKAMFAKETTFIAERQADWNRKGAEAETRFRQALKGMPPDAPGGTILAHCGSIRRTRPSVEGRG